MVVSVGMRFYVETQDLWFSFPDFPLVIASQYVQCSIPNLEETENQHHQCIHFVKNDGIHIKMVVKADYWEILRKIDWRRQVRHGEQGPHEDYGSGWAKISHKNTWILVGNILKPK